MNKIICAAIKIYIDSENIKIYRGHRHNNCIDCMNSELSWGYNRKQILEFKSEQGFITSENVFVDRVTAFKIAKESKQFLNNKLYEKEEGPLYSEDIY